MYRGFRFYSHAALDAICAGETKITRDLFVPKRLVKDMLLSIEQPTLESVRSILEVFGEVCVITREEDKSLNGAGLGDQMPKTWKPNQDRFARYQEVGIECVENTEIYQKIA